MKFLLILTLVLALNLSTIYIYSADPARPEPTSQEILRTAIRTTDKRLLQKLVYDYGIGRTDRNFCFRGTMAAFGPDMGTRPSDPLEYARLYAPSLVSTLVAARTEADEDARAATLAFRIPKANPQEAC